MEKIALYDWILNFINEKYDIQYLPIDLNNMLRKSRTIFKTDHDIKNHMLGMDLRPKNLTDRIFDWRSSKIHRSILIDMDYNWYLYCEENYIDNFNQIDIFPKRKKVEVIFDC